MACFHIQGVTCEECHGVLNDNASSLLAEVERLRRLESSLPASLRDAHEELLAERKKLFFSESERTRLDRLRSELANALYREQRELSDMKSRVAELERDKKELERDALDALSIAAKRQGEIEQMRADLLEEQRGKMLLRSKFGAHDSETYPHFVERLALTAQNLRRALANQVVDLSAERSWCRICRTECNGAFHGRYTHPHSSTCVLSQGPHPGDGDPVLCDAEPQADDGHWWRAVSQDTAFAPPFGTIRKCYGCGALVAGGPTCCARCAAAQERKG